MAQQSEGKDRTEEKDSAEEKDRTESTQRSTSDAGDSHRPAGDETPPIPPVGDVPTISYTPPAESGGELAEIEGYDIIEELGRGGMGRVFKARQCKLDRVVALKQVLDDHAATPEAQARFLKEAEAVAALVHPNIVPIYELGEQNGQPYYIMEYLDGGTLATRLKERGEDAREAAEGIATLARAVDYAHQQGIIHRDLKPANILLTSGGVPKIADFGLAKSLERESELTSPDAVLGTPGYMAPEQASGKAGQATAAVDIYALGVMLYEALTGQRPFRGENNLDVIRQITTAEPPPPSSLRPGVPRDVETICLKCLEKDPADRYATAGELAADLGRFLAGEPIRARRTPAWERAVKWVKRRPAPAAAIGLALVLAIVTAAFILGVSWLRQQALEKQLAQADKLIQQAKKYEPIAGSPYGIGKDFLDNADSVLAALADSSDSSPEVFEAMARLRLEQSKVHLRLNDSDRALLSAQAARRTAQRFKERHPKSVSAGRLLALCQARIGYIHFTRGKLDDARAEYEAALAYYQDDNAPRTPQDMADHASAMYRLADVLANTGKKADEQASQKYDREALRIRQELTNKFPKKLQWQVDYLASMFQSKFYRHHTKYGDWPPGTIQVLETCEAELQSAIDQRKNDDWVRMLCTVLQHKGFYYQGKEKNVGEARVCYAKAASLAKRMADRLPEDSLWAHRHFGGLFSQILLFSADRFQRDLKDHLNLCEEMQKNIIDKLVKKDRENAYWQEYQVILYKHHAMRYSGLAVLGESPRRNYARAADLLAKGLALAEFLARKHPRDPKWPYQIRSIQLDRVMVLTAREEDQKALEVYRGVSERFPEEINWRQWYIDQQLAMAKILCIAAHDAAEPTKTEQLTRALELLSETRPMYLQLSKQGIPGDEKRSKELRDNCQARLTDVARWQEFASAQTGKELRPVASKSASATKDAWRSAGDVLKSADKRPEPPTKIDTAVYRLLDHKHLGRIEALEVDRCRFWYEKQPTSYRAASLVEAYFHLFNRRRHSLNERVRATAAAPLKQARDLLLKRRKDGSASKDEADLLGEIEKRLAGL